MKTLPFPICCLVAAVSVLPQQEPVFRGRVDLVAVDVHVLDGSGRPVAGLQPADFRITVDGQPRSIATADYVSYDVSAVRQPAPPSAPDVRPLFSSNVTSEPDARARTVLLVVDESNIRAGNGRQAIEAAEQFLGQLAPSDRVGLALLPYGRASIDPTTNRAAVREALRHVIGHLHPVQAELYSLGLIEAFAFANGDKRTWSEAISRECDNQPFATAATRAQCIQFLEVNARSMVSDARQRMIESTRSCLGLLNALAGLPDAKTLVLISEELPVSPYSADRAQFMAESRRVAEAAARARATVYVLHLSTPTFDVDTRLIPPTASEDADIRATGLEDVTGLTGGTRLMISGRPGVAFDRIALEISGYYLLGVRTEPSDRDGKPHAIAVEVTRPGLSVRARKVFAFDNPRSAVPDASAVQAVNRLLRAPGRAADLPLKVSTYAIPDPAGDAARIRVIISAEIDREAAAPRKLAVGYVIFDSKGKNAGGSVEELTLEPAPGHPDRPLCYLGAAIVAPGRYSLRLAAADTAQRLGVVEHLVDATLTEAEGVRLGELIVIDPARTASGKARPTVEAAVGDLLEANVEISWPRGRTPAAVSVRLEVAESAGGPALAGREMELRAAERSPRLQAAGSVSLASLLSGDYVARAVVSRAGGSELARVTRPIRIVERDHAPVGAAHSVLTAASGFDTLLMLSGSRPHPGPRGPAVSGCPGPFRRLAHFPEARTAATE